MSIQHYIFVDESGDPGKPFELCKQEGDKWYDNCLVVNAGSFYSVGGREQALFICQNVPAHLKEECYQRVVSQIISDPIDKKQKEVLCQRVEAPYQQSCFGALTSL